jgi:hypothetical protein
MKPWNSTTWKDTPDVAVTTAHVNRAMKALVEQCPDDKSEHVTLDAVMLGAAIVAYMEAFKKQPVDKWMLISVVHSMLEDDLPRWVIANYGFVHPSDWMLEDAKREHEERRIARIEKAKATREAKRAAGIEAEVQKRLAVAA